VPGRPLHPARGERRGFTLTEVLLVLALLVILATMSWPALDRAFSGTRLRKAADQVRAGFSGARVEAMQSGEVQLFRYAIDSAEYRIESRCQSQTTMADPLFDEGIEQEFAAEQ